MVLKRFHVQVEDDSLGLGAVHCIFSLSFFPPSLVLERLSITVQTDQSNSMAAQAALIADTIVGMKRALRKEQDSKFWLLRVLFGGGGEAGE